MATRTINLKLIEAFRAAQAALEKAKATALYPGTKVWVHADRYTGDGTVVTDNTCPVDQVAICLPNGNTWRYPADRVFYHGPLG
jgi:hypothetical protein